MTRVDEGANPDPGDQARLAGGGVPKQMGNDPCGKLCASILLHTAIFPNAGDKAQ
jgi:hypothetical protein